VKIRTEDNEFHLNDYHFIHRYRFVKNIGGGSDSTHVVLLDDFTQWNELAAAVTAASGRVEKTNFSAGGRQWQRKAGKTEIWPVAQSRTVELTNDQISALATWFNEAGYSDPKFPPKLDDAPFKLALQELVAIKKVSLTTVLKIQWPVQLPPGVGVDGNTRRGPMRDRYIWGDLGSVEEYPHIHCFVDGGHITSAHATIGPAPGSGKKRHPDFRSDLNVNRGGLDLTVKDEQMLDELERVLRALVSGEELIRSAPVKTPGRKKAVAGEPVVVPPVVHPVEFVKFAEAHGISIERVVRFAVGLEIAPSEIFEWSKEAFEQSELLLVD
jgi:hypothetical protein